MTFEEWLKSITWLHERDLPCIVSADLDGVACGLLQQHVHNWKVIGTYNGEAVNLYEPPEKVIWNRVVFIDVEIFRPAVRSIGNHLFALDDEDASRLRREYPMCASPNLWRGITVRESFQRKYPFSTLPLLLSSHAVRDQTFVVSRAWLALTLHTDSSFTNAAMYQANALDWLSVMGEGATAGLTKFCKLLARITAQQAIGLVHEVQQWAAEAGFGAKQRACRFDCGIAHDRERVGKIIDRLRNEVGVATDLPFRDAPVMREEFGVRKLPLPAGSKRRQTASFDEARKLSVISMAATARNQEGLSITVPSKNTAIQAFR